MTGVTIKTSLKSGHNAILYGIIFKKNKGKVKGFIFSGDAITQDATALIIRCH
jgi:hypothetical protein